MALLPAYLEKTGYKNPDDQDNGPFQFGTEMQESKNLFMYMVTENQKLLGSFQTFFEADRGSRPNWVDWFPVKEKILDDATRPIDEESVLYVDVAGGRGHELLAFKRKFPEYPGRYVLYDLPQVVEDETLQLGDAVEKRGFNFFQDTVLPGKENTRFPSTY